MIHLNLVSFILRLLIVIYLFVYLENNAHTRWQRIHTMDEAKIALKLLLKHIAENRRKQCVKEYERNELQVCIFLLYSRL